MTTGYEKCGCENGQRWDTHPHNGSPVGEPRTCSSCGGAGYSPPVQKQMAWDNRFLAMAYVVASWSKDPSSKNGAVLVRPDRTVAAVGFNGFPKDMRDDPRLYDDREVKYDRVIHAEMNAIFFCRETLPLADYTLYTTGPSCSRCAVHMIQAGIRRFVFPAASPEQAARWGVSRSLTYFDEVGAEVISLERRFTDEH